MKTLGELALNEVLARKPDINPLGELGAGGIWFLQNWAIKVPKALAFSKYAAQKSIKKEKAISDRLRTLGLNVPEIQLVEDWPIPFFVMQRVSIKGYFS